MPEGLLYSREELIYQDIQALTNADIATTLERSARIVNCTITDGTGRALRLPPVDQMAGNIIIIYLVAINSGSGVSILPNTADRVANNILDDTGAFDSDVILNAANEFSILLSLGTRWLVLNYNV